jgi:polyhydroxybutyrate depolymerase
VVGVRLIVEGRDLAEATAAVERDRYGRTSNLPTDTTTERWRPRKLDSRGNLAGMSEPNSGPGAGYAVCQLTGQWRGRQYLLHVPGPATEAAGPRPLLVQLHGRGIDAARFDLWTGFSALAHEAGFVLAMPEAVGEIWNDGRYGAPTEEVDDVGFIGAVIEDVGARLSIDRGRVYLVGMSNGSAMAGRFACERPDLIAGIGQVAGTVGASVAAQARPSLPLPVISFHGTADRSAPYIGGRAGGLGRLLMMRHRAGPAVGVDEWAAFWRSVNGVGQSSEIETLGADVSVRRWRGSNPLSDLDFYRIEGGGHTWPGAGARIWIPPIFGRISTTIDATRLIWEFLSVHRRG